MARLPEIVSFESHLMHPSRRNFCFWIDIPSNTIRPEIKRAMNHETERLTTPLAGSQYVRIESSGDFQSCAILLVTSQDRRHGIASVRSTSPH